MYKIMKAEKLADKIFLMDVHAPRVAKNAKPGSLTSKANLVNKYNSGVKTEEVIPEKQDNKKKK